MRKGHHGRWLFRGVYGLGKWGLKFGYFSDVSFYIEAGIDLV